MRRFAFTLGVATWLIAALFITLHAWAYVEIPYTLGRMIAESSHVVLMEVEAVNQEKNLIIFKKLKDLKGQHPEKQLKHNIGTRGFHAREWQTIKAWAAPGKKAVFFHNGGASETCIGSYWYQCYREGEWWGMSHAEPYLLRTYCGDAGKLADAVTAMLQGKEVAVPCMVDGQREQLHLRKGKMQIMKASLKRQDYNAKRDFIAFGGDPVDIPQFKTVTLLAESSAGWKFVPAGLALPQGNRWTTLDFDDATWAKGKSPLGYGEPEISKRGGTQVALKGQPFVFRREFTVVAELLQQKNAVFRLAVASDDNAAVYLNGAVVDQDPEQDHEFAYWNREVDLKPQQFRPGRNVVAVFVKNGSSSSDIYLDMEISALIPVPTRKTPEVSRTAGVSAKPRPLPPETLPPELAIDKAKRTVTVPCTIAPRQLPHLKDVYPIEVIATYPHPQGQKAHETIVNFQGIRPSMVHRALMNLGLKPGAPARGEGQRPNGPEVDIYLEAPDAAGKPRRWSLDQVLIDTRTGKPPPPLTWHFTGSVFRQPDPLKDEFVYGANLTGTLIAVFAVTDETVLQAGLTAAAESAWRLETNRKVLPKEGTRAKLVIQAK
ncbi:MAG: YdjY domain-containing protein [Gemmataceae bacterium]|nr:YdjY domain-containing protein [Gemmataceae bacterium]